METVEAKRRRKSPFGFSPNTKRIRILMNEQGLRPIDLAQILKTDRGLISKVINGKRPTSTLLGKIAKALHVSLEEILNGATTEETKVETAAAIESEVFCQASRRKEAQIDIAYAHLMVSYARCALKQDPPDPCEALDHLKRAAESLTDRLEAISDENNEGLLESFINLLEGERREWNLLRRRRRSS